MQPYSPSDLVEQLSRNSIPYHDPLARIHWEHLSEDKYWVPEQALSLYGLPQFSALPDWQRKRLSHYEFLNFIEAGIWLEGIFMERIAYSLRNKSQSRTSLKYHLHELREEAGHTLVFLETMERSGLSIPHVHHSRLKLVDLFGRYAPMNSLIFWIATLIGEEIPDRLNRYIRAHPDSVSSVVVEICTMHIIDEARHIAYARELLEEHLANVGSWQRTLLRPLIERLLRQFITIFYYPNKQLYELAGLYPGTQWVEAARHNPHRRDFINKCINPTQQLFRQRGFPIAWDAQKKAG